MLGRWKQALKTEHSRWWELDRNIKKTRRSNSEWNEIDYIWKLKSLNSFGRMNDWLKWDSNHLERCFVIRVSTFLHWQVSFWIVKMNEDTDFLRRKFNNSLTDVLRSVTVSIKISTIFSKEVSIFSTTSVRVWGSRRGLRVCWEQICINLSYSSFSGRSIALWSTESSQGGFINQGFFFCCRKLRFGGFLVDIVWVCEVIF